MSASSALDPRQPGGFDRDFFAHRIGDLVEDYVGHRDLEPGELIVELQLRSGEVLPVVAVGAAPAWGMFLTESDELRLLPYDQVAGIRVGRRPDPEPEQHVGFTAERLDDPRPPPKAG